MSSVSGGLQPKSGSVHAVSPVYVPDTGEVAVPVGSFVALRVVPPTPVTAGSTAGKPGASAAAVPAQLNCAAPLSPEEAKTDQP